MTHTLLQQVVWPQLMINHLTWLTGCADKQSLVQAEEAELDQNSIVILKKQ